MLPPFELKAANAAFLLGAVAPPTASAAAIFSEEPQGGASVAEEFLAHVDYGSAGSNGGANLVFDVDEASGVN